ncbi:hypothetical protein RI367_006958 [Sorochytrium milnesiophthora]
MFRATWLPPVPVRPQTDKPDSIAGLLQLLGELLKTKDLEEYTVPHCISEKTWAAFLATDKSKPFLQLLKFVQISLWH